VAAYETTESTLSGLQLYNNCAAGLSFDLGFNNNVIADAVISRDTRIACVTPPAASACVPVPPLLVPGKVGIFMRDSRDNVFHGVRIHNSREHGVFIAQADAGPTTAATGNSFVALTVTAGQQAGVRINDASCVGNMVCAAQLTGNAQGGLSQAVPGLAVPCRAGCGRRRPEVSRRSRGAQFEEAAYREQTGFVDVLAVLHTARDWPKSL
jgi:hypothetical protein